MHINKSLTCLACLAKLVRWIVNLKQMRYMKLETKCVCARAHVHVCVHVLFFFLLGWAKPY